MLTLAELAPEQLTEELSKLDKVVATARADKAVIAREIERRSTREQIRAKLGALSDPEKAALLQELLPKGLPSAESVGTPGK